MGSIIFVLFIYLDIDRRDVMDMKSLTKLIVHSSKSVTRKETATFPDNRLEIRIQLV